VEQQESAKVNTLQVNDYMFMCQYSYITWILFNSIILSVDGFGERAVLWVGNGFFPTVKSLFGQRHFACLAVLFVTIHHHRFITTEAL